VILSYLAVDWYFVPPRHEFGQTNNLDFYILAGFVIVAATISHLVSSLKTAAMLATERAERIALLGDQQLRLEREAVRTRETREAEAMKNALIASIAHDLRSPITTVKMLADPEYGIDPAVALRRIGDEADRINRYLSTMRHFSDVGTTGVLMNVESHVVDDLIGTAIASYASALRAREVRVTQEPGTRILLLRCDLTLSLQVLGNLLQNAARYSPASTPIDVWTVSDGAFGRIVVADRGPGVLPEDVERIFKPRERGASASVDGQGMGLAIARTFARAQLGDVVYVAREGGGSEFSFVLPRSTELAS
jgi:two-component system sensor histidine kinase KdpD